MAFPFCFRFHTQTSRKECIFVIGKIPGWEIWSELLKGEIDGSFEVYCRHPASRNSRLFYDIYDCFGGVYYSAGNL